MPSSPPPPPKKHLHPGLVASYRLQMTADFGFDDAAKVLPYLATLGISHVYLSPILQAAAGSAHGYDIVDHNRLSEELGGEAAYARFCHAATALGLKQIIDIVPNHMSIHDQRNAWWWDLLEDGPGSRFASYFDVDWDPPEAKNRNVLLVPILGDHRGKVLEKREIRLVRNGGRFVFRYHEHAVPVAFHTIGQLLNKTAESEPLEHEVETKLKFFADAYVTLPAPSVKDAVRRNQHKIVLIELVSAFFDQQPGAGAAVDRTLAKLSDDPAALDDFLNLQNHRLAYWKTGDRELDYRRFFDVNSLVGLRVEEEDVFRDTHRTIERLVRSGCVDGLRVDHIDGLADPQRYLERLRALAPKAWVVVEKILARDEALRASWPVHGTTGYDFLNEVMGVFVDQSAEGELTNLFAELTGEKRNFFEVSLDKRDAVLKEGLAADVDRLNQLLSESCASTRMYRDYTRFDLRQALRAFIAAFPVYRSYVHSSAHEDDVAWATTAARIATQRRPDLDPELFTLISNCLLRRPEGPAVPSFSQRLQQLTSPAMAKGVEDTAFYAWSRFIALNEVGGNPDAFGTSVIRFHEHNREAQAETPSRMIATATHDTKRGEDVRARLVAISEDPVGWRAAVTAFRSHNAPKKKNDAPDADSEYLFYQTLVGAWPVDEPRAQAFMRKAIRESKARTSWTTPNEAYEKAVEAFVGDCYADADFLSLVERFTNSIRLAGETNSLAQTLLKLTSPGVPDLYQGTELWSFDLVDPDNRRPVDWPLRAQMLDEVKHATLAQVMKHRGEGMPKLMLIHRALELRRRHKAAFEGEYEPISAQGRDASKVIAFHRGGEVVVAVPRLTQGRPDKLSGVTLQLPRGKWVNVLTGEHLSGHSVTAGELFARFPVGLLERIKDAP